MVAATSKIPSCPAHQKYNCMIAELSLMPYPQCHRSVMLLGTLNTIALNKRVWCKSGKLLASPVPKSWISVVDWSQWGFEVGWTQGHEGMKVVFWSNSVVRALEQTLPTESVTILQSHVKPKWATSKRRPQSQYKHASCLYALSCHRPVALQTTVSKNFPIYLSISTWSNQPQQW